MTNVVFIEHTKVPKDHAKALKEDLQSYAISVALKFPAETISQDDKVRVAKLSVRTLLERVDLSTKNLSVLLHDEVIGNLQKLYFKLKKKSNYYFLLEMIKVLKFLKRNHPRKYRKIYKSLERRLNSRQKLILSLYLNPKIKGRKQPPTYQAIGKIIKSTPGPISGEVKQMVKSIHQVFRAQRIQSGR